MPDIKQITVALSRTSLELCTLPLQVNWYCPRCNAPRGEVMQTQIPIGRQSLKVNFWVNPCGHHDSYRAMVSEAMTNGLNRRLQQVLNTYLNKGLVEDSYIG
ncbi:hypothetical protein [Thalassomonas actiniarum]|uniref:Uncharacterized protein n=1 Tax=Thalassomonas actiniarum TaxID=485447 RepID=A0AAF0C4L6_9GAMM|nr:hypothetical protein [Thalassomonas actiniarum]WDD99954.1 hypothetical protein SG35_004645 [Thalassomonas actiniarum]